MIELIAFLAVLLGTGFVYLSLLSMTSNKLKLKTQYFNLAFGDFVSEHLNLEFMRKIVGVGSEAAIEGCKHTNHSLPVLLTDAHSFYKELPELIEQAPGFNTLYKLDTGTILHRWKIYVDQALRLFTKCFSFTGQSVGEGAAGLTVFSVVHSCRTCQAKDPLPLARPVLTDEEIKELENKKYPLSGVEVTMLNTELNLNKEEIRFDKVKKTTHIVAAILAICAACAAGFTLYSWATVWPVINLSFISILASFALLILNASVILGCLELVKEIERLKSLMEFYRATFEQWKRKHAELYLLRRVAGLDPETSLIMPSSPLTRENLQALVAAISREYTNLDKGHRDKLVAKEYWKLTLPRLLKKFGLDSIFAVHKKTSVKTSGSVRISAVWGVRGPLDRVFKGSFDAERYLRGIGAGKKIPGGDKYGA